MKITSSLLSSSSSSFHHHTTGERGGSPIVNPMPLVEPFSEPLLLPPVGEQEIGIELHMVATNLQKCLHTRTHTHTHTLLALIKLLFGRSEISSITAIIGSIRIITRFYYLY